MEEGVVEISSSLLLRRGSADWESVWFFPIEDAEKEHLISSK
jgi:hypothetical protein